MSGAVRKRKRPRSTPQSRAEEIAVSEIRTLGQRLVESEGLTVPEACAVLARAMGSVLREGLASVFAAAVNSLTDG